MLNMSDKSFKKAFLTFKDPVSDVQPWSVGSNNNKKLKTHNFCNQHHDDFPDEICDEARASVSSTAGTVNKLFGHSGYVSWCTGMSQSTSTPLGVSNLTKMLFVDKEQLFQESGVFEEESDLIGEVLRDDGNDIDWDETDPITTYTTLNTLLKITSAFQTDEVIPMEVDNDDVGDGTEDCLAASDMNAPMEVDEECMPYESQLISEELMKTIGRKGKMRATKVIDNRKFLKKDSIRRTMHKYKAKMAQDSPFKEFMEHIQFSSDILFCSESTRSKKSKLHFLYVRNMNKALQKPKKKTHEMKRNQPVDAEKMRSKRLSRFFSILKESNAAVILDDDIVMREVGYGNGHPMYRSSLLEKTEGIIPKLSAKSSKVRKELYASTPAQGQASNKQYSSKKTGDLKLKFLRL